MSTACARPSPAPNVSIPPTEPAKQQSRASARQTSAGCPPSIRRENNVPQMPTRADVIGSRAGPPSDPTGVRGFALLPSLNGTSTGLWRPSGHDAVGYTRTCRKVPCKLFDFKVRVFGSRLLNSSGARARRRDVRAFPAPAGGRWGKSSPFPGMDENFLNAHWSPVTAQYSSALCRRRSLRVPSFSSTWSARSRSSS